MEIGSITLLLFSPTTFRGAGGGVTSIAQVMSIGKYSCNFHDCSIDV